MNKADEKCVKSLRALNKADKSLNKLINKR